jgi:hypothetical protein
VPPDDAGLRGSTVRVPLITLLVVVGSANHYWLDAVVAAALLLVALRVTGLVRDGTVIGPVPDAPLGRAAPRR